MSNEELALAVMEIALKCEVIPSHSEELPYDSKGVSPEYCDERAGAMVAFYRSALKAISEK